MSKVTQEQRDWLTEHPEFSRIGGPRPDVRFSEFGTLYADGSYVKQGPGSTIILKPGCFGVGIMIRADVEPRLVQSY